MILKLLKVEDEGTDYIEGVIVKNSVVIPAGADPNKTITYTPQDESYYYSNQTIRVTILEVSGGAIGFNEKPFDVKLIDNEGRPEVFVLSELAHVIEGNDINLTFNIKGATKEDAIVTYFILPTGGASAGDFLDPDLLERRLTVTIPAGESPSALVSISVKEDSIQEVSEEGIQIQLDSVSGGASIIDTRTLTNISIIDNDQVAYNEAPNIQAGNTHSCILHQNGSVQCWGWNAEGQLGHGDSNTESEIDPVHVTGLSSDVTAISAGQLHTCVVQSGAAKCWGYNPYGQLGNGANSDGDGPITYNEYSPADVVGLSGDVITISAGEHHTCAIVNGAVKCWGYNLYGQLGNGANEDGNGPAIAKAYSPVDVVGLSGNITAISAGSYHTCAIVNGAAKCWGDNTSGQLGNGANEDGDGPAIVKAYSPVDVPGLSSGVTAISAGFDHTCAIVNGAAKCWGRAQDGKLGNNDATTDHYVPVDVASLSSGVTAISAGSYHTCAIVNGSAKCWGSGLYGRLGTGSGYVGYEEKIPVDVPGLSSGVTAISAQHHTCALVDGAAKCWGPNGYYQLGNENPIVPTNPIYTPVEVAFSN